MTRPGLACLCLAFVGCASSYRIEQTYQEQLPGEAVLRLRFRHNLTRPEFLGYHPQEWASPAISEQGPPKRQGIFVGSSAKRFVSLRLNGSVRWRLTTTGAVRSGTLYDTDRGRVYFGTDDGVLYAVDAESGSTVWTYETRGVISHAPVVQGQLIFFTTSENRVYALNVATGQWRWQYEREPPEGFSVYGFSGAAVRDQLVFCGFSDGIVAALKTSTGEVVWTRSVTGGRPRFFDADATPAFLGDTLIVAGAASGIYAMDPLSGSVLWHFPMQGVIHLAAGETRVFAAAPKVGVFALNQRGEQLWRQALLKGAPTLPVPQGDHLLVSNSRSGLFVVSKASGALLQYFDTGGHGASAPPAASVHLAAVVTNFGSLYTFENMTR